VRRMIGISQDQNLRPRKDTNDVECHYCNEMRHYQYQCKKSRAEVKEFKKSLIYRKFCKGFDGFGPKVLSHGGEVSYKNMSGFFQRVVW
jgi:hypothetical protein